ncbi:MAG TPA: hypothetical protein VMI31_19310 [Fimbriimonadaceae bacterium]|nr:hypothetical protein [Fimbriimonadaceae bacterium]
MNFGYEPEHADAEKVNAFWEYVRGRGLGSPSTTIYAEMDRRGWFPASPEALNDEDLPAALERLVLDLSWLHVYLHATDHLPDRELYSQIFEHVHQNDTDLWPDDPGSAISISFISHGTDEELQIFLRYYADETEREWWKEHYPGLNMPIAELPPYPRPWVPDRPLFD